MKEVIYSSDERRRLRREMEIFAMESVANLGIDAIKRRRLEGAGDQPIQLEGTIDGVDFYVWLGPEGSQEEDFVLIDKEEG